MGSSPPLACLIRPRPFAVAATLVDEQKNATATGSGITLT